MMTDVPTAGRRLACFEMIDDQLQQVEERIDAVLAETDKHIRQSVCYLLSSPGKMIRPGLVLLSGASTGTLTSEHIDLAAMAELIHRASLLHDDVIDEAKMRRQKQTANARWGNTNAVLLGDYLLSRAFWLGLSVNVHQAADILSSTARDICRGELQQNFRKGQWDLSPEAYFDIIEAKTATLFISSCRLGAAASKASEQQSRALADFGRHLGMAFQISDDLMDIIDTDQRIGKTLGTDLAQEKLTLPVIHWLRHDLQTMPLRIDLLRNGCDRQRLVHEMTQCGSIAYVFAQIDDHILRAKQALECMPKHPAINALYRLADYVALRMKQ